MKRFGLNAASSLCALVILGLAGSAAAQLITPDPSLPPGGTYTTSSNITYNAPGLVVALTNIQHNTFTGIVRTPSGANETEQFNSILSGLGSVNGGASFPVNASGPTTTVTFGKIGNVTGTFNTEMLQLNLSAVTPLGPALLRESPTLASTGQTTIADAGGGLFRIDSFFDIFTELSVDGGATWIPQTGGPTHLTLVPEPASISLVVFGAMSLLVRRRR